MIELKQGDCLELMQGIPDGSIDMILCDLPYGTTACKWDTVIPFEPLWAQYKRIIKGNGVITLTASQPFTSALVMSNLQMFRYCLVWNKKRGYSPGRAKYRPMPSFEDICLFANGKTTYNPQMRDGEPYTKAAGGGGQHGDNGHHLGYKRGFVSINTGTRYPLSVIDISWSPTTTIHPSQKPVALMEYLIRTYTNEGETVLDNCMGSGSTGVACVNINRNFIGIELDADYFKIAENRIADAQNKPEQIPLISNG